MDVTRSHPQDSSTSEVEVCVEILLRLSTFIVGGIFYECIIPDTGPLNPTQETVYIMSLPTRLST